MVSPSEYRSRQTRRRETNNYIHDEEEEEVSDSEDMALLRAIRAMGYVHQSEAQYLLAIEELERVNPTAHRRAIARARSRYAGGGGSKKSKSKSKRTKSKSKSKNKSKNKSKSKSKSKSKMRITETVTRVGSDKDAVVLDRIYKVAKSMGMRFKTGRIHADDINIKKDKELVVCNLSRLHHYYLRKKSTKIRRQNNKKTTNKYGVHLSRKEQIEQNRISVKLNALYEAAKLQGLKMKCKKNNLSDFDRILGEVNRLGHTVARSLRNIHAYNLQKRTRTRSSRNRKKKRKSGTHSSRIK